MKPDAKSGLFRLFRSYRLLILFVPVVAVFRLITVATPVDLNTASDCHLNWQSVRRADPPEWNVPI